MNQFSQQRRPNPMEDLKKFFRDSSLLPRLIIINVGIWVLVQIVFIIGWAFNRSDLMMEQFILEYFALPANLEMLMVRLVPERLILSLGALRIFLAILIYQKQMLVSLEKN